MLRTLPLLLALVATSPLATRAAEPVPRLDDPDAPLLARIEAVLDGGTIGERSLRDALRDLSFGGCLAEIGPELTSGLDALRLVHVAAVERRSYPRAWQLWERSLPDLSDDAWQLLSTWLDSPQNARRLYLCEDDLPRSWRGVDAAGFVRESLTWFDAAVAERDPRLRRASSGDREQAVMELYELRASLIRRFIATFPEGETHEALLVEMEKRLDLMWETLVEPFHLGYTPKARTTELAAAPGAMGRARFQTPFTGMAIPDPRDVAARDRVARSWRRSRRSLDREIRDLQGDLDTVVAAIDDRVLEGPADPELDRLVREAARTDARLASTVATLERMQHKVRHYSTGRSWIDGMLSNGYRRRAVKRLARRETGLQEDRQIIEETMERAVAAGAMPPGSLREETLLAMSGRRIGGRDEVGPGNWLAGLPEGRAPVDEGTSEVGIAPGSGWVPRSYEGPMPTPSGAYSDATVDAMRARHPALDDADARILLGLVQLAYRELGTRAAVEAAVLRSLDTAEGLSLLGEEGTLSDLWIRGRPTAEQPIVTFVLKLFF